MITVKKKGNYKKATKYLAGLKKPINRKNLELYGDAGVIALMNATPVDTGKTRNSWYYRIVEQYGTLKIEFCNSNIIDYVPIAVILQYGHATGNGGYVEGIDYINPAIRPVFERIKEAAWREVTTVEV